METEEATQVVVVVVVVVGRGPLTTHLDLRWSSLFWSVPTEPPAVACCSPEPFVLSHGQQNKQSAFADTGAGETESAVWLGDTTEEPNTD
ncbi:unnamed protein product [Gadus morhua 'NCC']